MHSCITHKVILPACLRYRLLSETRVAVCLILESVFVLWQEGAPEGSVELLAGEAVFAGGLDGPLDKALALRDADPGGVDEEAPLLRVLMELESSILTARRGPANSGEPAWGCPSPGTSSDPTVGRSGWKTGWGRNEISDPHPRWELRFLSVPAG